jgi:hypothetical protein
MQRALNYKSQDESNSDESNAPVPANKSGQLGRRFDINSPGFYGFTCWSERCELLYKLMSCS